MSAFDVVPGKLDDLQVRYVQEYLALLGFHTSIDGSYGPATAQLIREWRDKYGVVPHGVMPTLLGADMGKRFGLTADDMGKVHPLIITTWDIQMMRTQVGLTDCEDEAMIKRFPDAKENNFGIMAKTLAGVHAIFRPREAGADNFGPWVRMYMDGQEGLPWCAGFVSTIWKQTEKLTGLKRPIPGSWSCTSLANQAMGARVFHKGEDLKDVEIPVGSLFIRRKKRKDGSFFGDAWEHTGIVTRDLADKNIIQTLEGNTNDEGSREGYEVCQHTLRRDNRDYIFPA